MYKEGENLVNLIFNLLQFRLQILTLFERVPKAGGRGKIRHDGPCGHDLFRPK